ncbi:peptidase M14 [Flavilitoribacter nigricans DSM 23189 = NBRC 102662]|uniref:Peptidase M14 n=2 Tax=Flavilitoribacter TaxID=2762562 RepID=A0A2D0N5Q1_FLAN2|nr:peptidase M14 [Flavilitoribacter nigricans DSM 23189 = NBRC 102662]
MAGGSLSAQVDLTPERFDFDPDITYDASIPTPESFLGYELGDQFTLYANAVAYFRALAAASDRIAINQYGATYEGKPLINLVVTAPANHDRMDAILEDHYKLMDTDGMSTSQVDDMVEEMPVFTSFSYNIHGNEASSTEAAMQVAYRLAAGQDQEIAEVLEQSVIIMFVCINPDGRDRYTYWYNSMVRSQVGLEPRDLEHYAPWPNGRTNHYWFDLNRDWVWGVHPESRGQVAEYRKWMPQVHVDYHEQGYNSNYFTTPGTTPRNLLLPDDYEPYADYFGRANIEQFNKHRINYFTRDAFDFFYPGYGSSYPSVMGAIGMLTEQGGIGAGRAIETNDGYVLLLRQRVFDHYITSLATIKASAARRQELLKYSVNAWNSGSSKSRVKTYILPAEQGGYLEDVLAIFQRQGIAVERATADFSVSAMDYRTGRTGRQDFKAGDLLVSADQPLHLLVHAIMEPALEIEDSVMYDMATWSAPLAYNLDAYSSELAVNVASEPLTAADAAENITKADANYAYVIDWSQRRAPAALAALWEKGYRVRSATEGFTDDEGREFPAGTLVILRGRNLEKADEIVADMRALAGDQQIEIVGYDTGRMQEGYDLASSRNRPIQQPRVALMVEPPFDTYTAGQIYFLFDWETKLPVQRIRTSVLQQTAVPKFGQRYGLADLNDYDVLILPGGGNSLKEVFGKEEINQLKTWIRSGGVVVATEDAVDFFTAKASKITDVKMAEAPKDSSETALYLPYKERQDYYGKKRIPGSALRANIDISHPLAFGLKPELYSLKFGVDALKPSTGLQTVGYYHRAAEDLLAAGYATEENLKHLAGNTFAGVMSVGQGKVVFLTDNTQYRMFWRGPSRMMQNAVMILPGF